MNINNNQLNFFILCGGSGKRMNDYSFPKPLNMINGKPLIYYTLMRLPDEIRELNFIVAPHLNKYNFSEIVINLFPKKKCNFYNLPYFTRGAIESAYLGTRDLNLRGSVVFLDNDNLYSFPFDFYKNYNNPFVGFCINNDNSSTNFSFINITSNNYNCKYVTNIKEKVRISNYTVCGIYGFKDLNQFKEIAFEVLTNDSNKNSNEYYMSILYNYLLKKEIPIEAIEFPFTCHIGTYKELNEALLTSKERLKLPQMRICFDLDNTIVTYPTVVGDYSTVKPINSMITLMRKLKDEGHIIIIHTARRMKTHYHNSGAALADIGEITFKTLKDFNIPYHEIIFGKPIADIYIDDRTINPYKNDMRLLGILDYKQIEVPLNKLDNNKYNSIELENDVIKKTGLSKFLDGEIYYYKYLSCITNGNKNDIKRFFPEYYNSYINDNGTSSLIIENINGIPFYSLYKNQMITENHLNELFMIIKKLHDYQCKDNNQTPINSFDIINNYSKKLRERFKIKDDYPFEDSSEIQNEILKKLDDYYNSQKNLFEISDFIHGDLWFSNIIIDYSNNIKLIDMKGKVYNTFNTGGHIYYDYGKLYQSFLGFDEIIYGDTIDITYKNKMKTYFENYVEKNGINLNYLKIITLSLIIGTFHFISNENTKKNLWNWIKTIKNF
jgi:capsule biosynthesis phosphatase